MPAVAAFSAFCSKVQLPRWTRAIPPFGKPSKSSVSQPLVELFGLEPPIGTTTSTGCTAPETSRRRSR